MSSAIYYLVSYVFQRSMAWIPGSIKSFIRQTIAQLNYFKILKFTLRFTINAPTCFGLTKQSSGNLQSVLR
jgi:hypothetical protein